MEHTDEDLYLSDSLPGRISEGEAFSHPNFFEILTLIRRKFFKNMLCFTTNGSLLEENFFRKLGAFRPIEITVSMHSTQPYLWAQIYGRDEKAAQIALTSLPRLKAARINLVGTIVPLPEICGWDDIEQTYAYLVDNGAKRMILYHPGYSRFTPPSVKSKINCPLDEYLDFAYKMKEKYDIPLLITNDRRSSIDLDIKTIISRTLTGNIKTFGGPFQNVIWLASEAAYERLSHLVEVHSADLDVSHKVVPVKNQSYGGNISVSGLLMVEDFVTAGIDVIEKFPETDLILIPSKPFDSFLRDLQGQSAHQIPDKLGRPVWVMDGRGGFNTLLGTLLGR
jgi:NifB/MoaA-like Fe-S oxidoreductase